MTIQLTTGATVLQAAGAQTANNNSQVAACGLQTASHTALQFRGALAYVVVTAASGTTPSMTVKLQDSPDGVNFSDTGAASVAITGAGTYRISLAQVGPFLRAVSTITGTTPSFTYSIQLVGTV